ncbi:MAG TPA: 50S ribosomal protein L9 [Thermomicrobiales bacterium]|jgi:large subunit ribosomal protein L9|nr:50S ribosomal protein L9 [Thermomicrobiales bacterium]
MKIILRKDVEKLGEAGSLATVKDGYARNYLIPQGMAIAATPGELKLWEHNQAVKTRKVERQERELQSFADKISGQTLTFEARAGEGGRLFGSVTAADIAEKLSSAVGEEIDRRKVVLSEPIRSTGEHTVTVNVIGKLRPQVKVIVNGVVDEADEDTAEATA